MQIIKDSNRYIRYILIEPVPDGKLAVDYWVTDNLDEDALNAIGKVVSTSSVGSKDSFHEGKPKDKKLMPIKVVSYPMEKHGINEKDILEIQSITKKKLKQSLFEIPAGYKESSMQ